MKHAIAELVHCFDQLLQFVYSNTSLQMALTQTNYDSQLQQLFINLLEKDFAIQQLLVELKEHQKIQQKIHQVKSALEEKDAQILQISTLLQEIQQQIQKVQHDISEKHPTSAQKDVELDDLISYSHRISGYTAAPFNFEDGKPTSANINPPFVTPAQWVNSILYPAKLENYKKNLQTMTTATTTSDTTMQDVEDSTTSASSTTVPEARPLQDIHPIFTSSILTSKAAPSALSTTGPTHQKIKLFNEESDEEDDD